ncbi:MAG: bifunctional acetate--CoA ligase family protein/GNAT family N-acetyltransferase [Pseudomonadota bacterium]
MSLEHVDTLFAPASIALFGATERPGRAGRVVMEQLRAAGFEGPIWPVNPKYGQVLGLRCYGSTDELPGSPALAIVATPPATVPEIIEALGVRGCRVAIVMTPAIQADSPLGSEMLQAAQRHGLRLLGPNSSGILRPPKLLAASTTHLLPLSGRLAFISQSGAVIGSVLDWATARGIGFSHIVSIGDQADIGIPDLLDHLATDAESRAILLYLEGITDAQAFMPAARAAARVKPVIALKGGRHRAGARAATSHSGALAGTDALFDAALARAGILRIRTIEELFDAAEALDHLRLRAGQPFGDRIAIVTNGGGAGVLAADAIGDLRGQLARFAPETREALAAALPSWTRPANPVDLDAAANGERYRAAMDAVLADPGVDAVIAIACPGALANTDAAAQAVIDAARHHRRPGYRAKPIFTCLPGDEAPTAQAGPARRALEAADIPCFATPDNAATGLGYLLRRARLLEEITAVPPSLPRAPAADWAAARAVIEAAVARGVRRLDEAEAKAVIAAAGITVVRTARAKPDPASARAVAEDLAAEGIERFALKALSDAVVHKSDIGGVVLDLQGPMTVEAAAASMLDHITEHHAIPVTGLSVQEMLRRPTAHELLCGISDDPVFGPALVFGAGGLGVEAEDDVVLALPPLDLGLARRMIGKTRVARRLAGYRTHPAADIDAIAAVMVRLGELARALPMINELDINPLLADGSGCVALDARITVQHRLVDLPAPNPRFAIRPYPAELEGSLALRDGTAVFCRPVKPEDAPRFAEFFRRATPEDLRLRFFSRLKEVPAAMIARLTQIDYARAIAFVAFEATGEPLDDRGEMLGVGRLAGDATGERAEFSVMVRSDLKGRGLGRALMERLIEHGRAEGIATIWGEILTDNTGMLTLATKLGFRSQTVPGEGMFHVELTLD